MDRFYSVAEHCILMSRWLEEALAYSQKTSDEVRVLALEALLHDATEAYVVDVPSPLKRFLSSYQDYEAGVAVAIAERFGHQKIDVTYKHGESWIARVVEAPEVKSADSRILLDERAALMSRHPLVWGVDSLKPLGVKVNGWDSQIVEQLYLERLEELGVLLQ